MESDSGSQLRVKLQMCIRPTADVLSGEAKSGRDQVKAECFRRVHQRVLAIEKPSRPPSLGFCEIARIQFPSGERNRAEDVQPVRYIVLFETI